MEVPAGKRKVMERFFSPVRQRRSERGRASNKVDLRGQGGMEGRNYTLLYSSLSSTSLSSEGSVEEDSFTVQTQLGTREHSQSCVDVRTFRESNMGSDRLAYTKLRSKSEDRLFQEEAKGLEGVTLYKPGGLNQSAEIPTPRWLDCSAHEPKRGTIKNGLRTDNIQRAKSMEVIALKLLHGPSTAPDPTAKGRAALGASSHARKHKDNQRTNVEQTAAKERLTKQKVKFSEFLDEITMQVLSPANLNFLSVKPQGLGSGRGVRGDGNANKNDNIKAGTLQDSNTWQEEIPLRHGADRRESGRQSISPDVCSPSSRQPGNHRVMDSIASQQRSSEHQPKEEGWRDMGGNKSSEQSPARTRLNPSAARCRSKPSTSAHASITLHLEQDPALPQQRASPASYHYKEGGSRLTDSASSLENCPARTAQLGMPIACKYTDSNSSPEETWATEGQRQATGRDRGDTNGCGAKELLTDTHRLKFLQEENEDLQRCLACATYRMEKMDSDFKASLGCLETELQRARADLGHLREKFWRLQENFSSTQQINEFMEEKLDTISQNMETERKGLKQQISELTNRLTSAQRTICALENINIPSLLPEMVSQHGHEELETSVNPPSFLDVTIFTPPASFMDKGPETNSGARSHSECPISSAAVPVAGLHCQVGAVLEDNGSYRPEEQESTTSQEEPTRPLRTSGTSAPRGCTLFTSWKPCLKANPPLEWFESLKGNESRAAGGEPEAGHLPSAGRFAARHDDPFGPIAREQQLTAAPSATSEGGRREFNPNRQQPPRYGKDRDPKSHYLLSGPCGEVSSSAGSEDEAVGSWSKIFAGKVPASVVRSQELGHHSLLSDFVKTFQTNGSASPCGSDGKAVRSDIGNHLTSPRANCDPSPQPSLADSKRWANQWGKEIGYQLFEVGDWSRNDDAPWRLQEGVRAVGGEEQPRGDLGAMTRPRPSSKHRPATAPKPRMGQLPGTRPSEDSA